MPFLTQCASSSGNKEDTVPDALTTEILMRCFIGLRGRAERLDPDQVIDSFSSVGPLLQLISTEDHQIIFGRRGTGKTHALRYLYATRREAGDCAIFVDMRNLGSDGSIYNDQSLPVTERATRLLIDTLAYIQDGILEYAINDNVDNLNRLSDPIDRLGSAISQVRVSGDTTITRTEGEASSKKSGIGIVAGVKNLVGDLSGSFSRETSSQSNASTVKAIAGLEY